MCGFPHRNRCGYVHNPALTLLPVKTAIISALIMFGIAVVISMAVAGLMKVLFLTIRRINTPKKG